MDVSSGGGEREEGLEGRGIGRKRGKMEKHAT